MYQLFQSKDELLAASLEEGASAHVFEQMELQASAPKYQGCRYLAVQIELQVKANLTASFRAEAEQGGTSEPDLLTRQLSLVFDGASARAGIGADDLSGLIAPTVATVLDPADMR
ncbi:hypothetical protein [Streptomyces canus]|uniref:hypothetical protein n=1 Tax=Streptomyces canus TaxID=58343 RepID=UPI00325285B1